MYIPSLCRIFAGIFMLLVPAVITDEAGCISVSVLRISNRDDRAEDAVSPFSDRVRKKFVFDVNMLTKQ